MLRCKISCITKKLTKSYFNQDKSIVKYEKTINEIKPFLFNLKTLFASSNPVESNTIENVILDKETNTLFQKESKILQAQIEEVKKIQKQSTMDKSTKRQRHKIK